MHNATTEQEILDDAFKALKNEINVDEIKHHVNSEHIYDVIVELHLNDRPVKFIVEVKTNVNNANLGNIVNQIRKYQGPTLLVTKYINFQLAQKLKDLDIPFIDTAGNAFINFPPLYIWITGRKPDHAFALYDRNAPWGPAKLQVVYALLCHANLINENYRKIALVADTALGTVNWTLRDLNIKGYLIIKNRKERKLVDKEKLLNRWVELYAEKLRPRTLLGRYEAKDDINKKQLNIIEYDAQWGGEIAAAKITNYLRPGEFTIYADKNAMNELIFRFKLIKNPMGNVELRQKFCGNDPIWGKQDTVHPILVYADLLATAEPRNIETARIIYDRYVTRYIE